MAVNSQNGTKLVHSLEDRTGIIHKKNSCFQGHSVATTGLKRELNDKGSVPVIPGTKAG